MHVSSAIRTEMPSSRKGHTMRSNRLNTGETRRRGAVAVMIAVTVPVMLAFAALSVDVGVMYNAKADLQRAADASALAAAARLSALDQGDPLALARQTARDTAAANPVLTVAPQLADSDIIFGKASINPVTHQVTFTPTQSGPDAVQVIVRKTDDSPNGPLPLYFARIFGRDKTNVQAEAVASITPRDIALVTDVSGSLVNDSQFRNWEDVTVNTYDVWDELPGGADGGDSVWAPSEVLSDPAQSAGPAWGFFKRLGFGDDPGDPSTYSVASDPGLIELGEGSRWSDSMLEDYLYDQGYSGTEVSAIMNPGGSVSHENRVAIALGLATWNSGITGGRWQTKGLSRVGNRDTSYSDSELKWEEPFLSNTAAASESIWRSYISNISNSGRRGFGSPFPNRYGVKTMLDYVLDQRRSAGKTPELASVPVQPMQAIKDATRYMADLLTNAQSFDQISLQVYSNEGTHKVDLTHDFNQVTAQLDSMNADGSTNMGQGMERGIEELTSSRARATARKVMILITDGNANVDESGRSSDDGGKAYALAQAAAAKALNITIFTISVGQDADQDIMQQIADLTGGVHFHAEGSIEQYSSQLSQIFAAVGGRRSVELIK